MELARQLKAEQALNEQYKAYKEEVATMKRQREGFKEEIAQLKLKMEAKNSQNTNNNAKIKELKANAEALEQKLKDTVRSLQSLQIQYASLENQNEYLIKKYKLQADPKKPADEPGEPQRPQWRISDNTVSKSEVIELRRLKEALSNRVEQLTRQNLKLRKTDDREDDWRATKKCIRSNTYQTEQEIASRLLESLCANLNLTRNRSEDSLPQIDRLMQLLIKHLQYFVHFTNRVAAQLSSGALVSEWRGLPSVTSAVEISEQILRLLNVY